MSLEVWVTLCDDCIESSKKIVSAFVQIELCHMKNAFMATIFNTIFEFSIGHKLKTTVTIN